jgi:RHS repeat-associated protein
MLANGNSDRRSGLNASGTAAVVDHIIYNSFGKVVGASNPCLFGYTGRPFDGNTKLQNNGARWYDAAIGSWLSEDPDNLSAGDTNEYRYCGNSPTNQTDPTGLFDLAKAVQQLDDDSYYVRQKAEDDILKQPATAKLLSALGSYYDDDKITLEQREHLHHVLDVLWSRFLASQVFKGSGEREKINTPPVINYRGRVIDATTDVHLAGGLRLAVFSVLHDAESALCDDIAKFFNGLDEHGTSFLHVSKGVKATIELSGDSWETIFSAIRAAAVKNPKGYLVLQVSLSFSETNLFFTGVVKGEYKIYVQSTADGKIEKQPISQGKFECSGEVTLTKPKTPE